eukprot:gene15924-3559_t
MFQGKHGMVPGYRHVAKGARSDPGAPPFAGACTAAA